MLERLVQEYRIWLSELIEILHVVCEDVVPAGRVGEEIYWRTKSLYRECSHRQVGKAEEHLLQYAKDGRALLDSVKLEITAAKREWGSVSYKDGLNGDMHRIEESIIRLRRANANAILSSLQMLVNFAELANACEESQQFADFYDELSIFFEIDSIDEVKRIRSGVVVEPQKQITAVKTDIIGAKQNQTPKYYFHSCKGKRWEGYVAG